MITTNNIKMAMRNLQNSRVVTAINIIGLTVGISISLLIFSFVKKELTTDRFIPGVENIYMLSNEDGYYFSYNMINEIRGVLPEIESLTFSSFDWSPQVFLAIDEKSFKVDRLLTADSCFFKVFPFSTIAGDPLNGMNAANRIVLTQSLAQKIFGDTNPIGRTVTYNATYLQGESLEVVAVIEDIPHNSTWDFEAVLSFPTNFKLDWYVNNMKHWGTRNYPVFLRLGNNANPDTVQSKLATLPFSNVPEWYRNGLALGLKPYSKVYFDVSESYFKNGDRFTLSIINITGFFILFLACINYINMVTAQREKRLKNVGISKTLGSGRYEILRQYIAESSLVLIASIAISLLVISLLNDTFNSLTNSQFTFLSFFSLSNLWILLLMLLFTIVATGVIPGYIFSRYRALITLNSSAGRGSSLFRSGLLVFQFIVSIALISGILLINRQYRYMSDYSTGFNRENIVYINTNDNIGKSIDAFVNEANKIPGVLSIAFSEALLGYNEQEWGRTMIVKGEPVNVTYTKMSVSPNFFEFFGIALREGRTFNKNSMKNQEHIFNASAMASFNVERKEDARMNMGQATGGQIVGIVDDFNFESLHVPIRPIGFMCARDFEEVMYIKTNTSDMSAFRNTMRDVERVWDELSPNFPLEYKFFDESWSALYAKDQQFRSILGITTAISLILSCLGLVGLTIFVTEHRTK